MPKNLQSNTFLQNRLYPLLSLCVVVWLGLSIPITQAVEKPPVFFSATEKIPYAQYTDGHFENKPILGSNPFVSFFSTTEVEHIDLHYWRALMRYQSEKKKQQDNLMSSVQSGVLNITEIEPADVIENNTQDTAQFIPSFGTTTGNNSAVVISGYLAPQSILIDSSFSEDDGSIPLASLIEISLRETVKIENAEIGDGPYGSSGTGSGDFDFYRINAQKNDVIVVDVDTPQPYGDLDPVVAVYDENGDFLNGNDDQDRTVSFDSYLHFLVPADGDYFISIGGFGAFILNDPMDATSGPGFGSEGVYDVTLSLIEADFYSFNLEEGDILGATISGAGKHLTLFSSDGTELMGSNHDAGYLYPQASELPWSGNATVSLVSNKTDTYAISVIGDEGDYTLKLEAFRPVLEQETRKAKQILYLDFNGATFDSAIFSGVFDASGVVTLSPLDDFLANWGFTAADKDPLIDIIQNTVKENLQTDIRMRGLNGDFSKSKKNGDFDIKILNSRDKNRDLFGRPHVSRVIVGGTRFELGIPGDVISLAQSVDVGNFETEETAVVLLDILSGGNEWGYNSLNEYDIQPPETKLNLVGTAIGNLIAHEAGHLFGNWDTAQTFLLPNLMDYTLNNMRDIIGVGEDSIFGTGDDFDVDFGEDFFHSSEGFTGIEDTLNVIAFGLPAKADDLLVHLDYAQGKASAQGNLLTWHTLTERDTAGFCIVRAQQDAQGYYTDVTFLKPAAPQAKTLVPTTATQCSDEHLITATGEGTIYRYFDRSVDTGITYHYLIRDFDMQGQITDHWAHKMAVTAQ